MYETHSNIVLDVKGYRFYYLYYGLTSSSQLQTRITSLLKDTKGL